MVLDLTPPGTLLAGFTHWVLFDLPAETRHLDAGAGTMGKNPAGSVLGFTDWGVSECDGPAPPPGDDPHRYQITVYALDMPTLGMGATTTYPMFNFLIRGHVLARGTLTGFFGH
jgi:Raf kinase inhibitor-like YbhB/YbcL family protein